MLALIEILFFFLGLWGLIKGSFPRKLLSLLFGKGDYEIHSSKARVFAILLISPFPVTLLASFIFKLVGISLSSFGLIFEFVYVIGVLITSIVVAKKMRFSKIPVPLNSPPSISTSELNPIHIQQVVENPISIQERSTKRGSVILLLVLFVNLALLGLMSTCFSVWSISSIGFLSTGSFWKDYLPYILSFLFLFGGILGTVLLALKLKKLNK